MKVFYTVIILALTLFACGPKSASEQGATTTADAQDSKFTPIDAVYSFYATSDQKFCSTDSIIPSDCSGGDVLFTPKGHVLLIYYCMGNDTATYYIGTYKQIGENISCLFNQKYSYREICYDCPEMNQKPIDPNGGVLKPSREDVIVFQKITCPNFDYHFKFSHDPATYVMEKAKIDADQSLRKIIASIGRLADL